MFDVGLGLRLLTPRAQTRNGKGVTVNFGFVLLRPSRALRREYGGRADGLRRPIERFRPDRFNRLIKDDEPYLGSMTHSPTTTTNRCLRKTGNLRSGKLRRGGSYFPPAHPPNLAFQGEGRPPHLEKMRD
jgi:hypothetical protein